MKLKDKLKMPAPEESKDNQEVDLMNMDTGNDKVEGEQSTKLSDFSDQEIIDEFNSRGLTADDLKTNESPAANSDLGL